MVHYAAGILPLTWGSDGAPLFLVGQDVRDQSWSDFGGKCERSDKNCPLTTAIREFTEETFGCLADCRQLRQRLHAGNYVLLKSRTQNGHPYFMYVIEVPFVPGLRASFAKTLAFFRHKNVHRLYVEKTDVQYLTLEELSSPDVPKRSVFQSTIELHAASLQRIVADRAPWPVVCSSIGAATRAAEDPRPAHREWPARPDAPDPGGRDAPDPGGTPGDTP